MRKKPQAPYLIEWINGRTLVVHLSPHVHVWVWLH